MVSNLQSLVKSEPSADLYIAEFGLLNSSHLDQSKAYSGFLYRLTADVSKAICEALSFNANFDLPSLRSACIDICKNQGWIVLEIDRNTKPADISVRYSRDRWQVQEVVSKGPEGLRPWIKSIYTARVLDDSTLCGVAQLLQIAAEDLEQFYLRFNLKERTWGLIAEREASQRVPGGSFMSFNLSEHALPAVPGDDETGQQASPGDSKHGDQQEAQPTQAENQMQMSEQAQAEIEQKASEQPVLVPSKTISAPQRAPYVSSSPPAGEAKYATYSKSEVDYMLKQQAESIMNALGGKISAQQRAFQEAVAAQEKAFNKLSDNYLSQFENSRMKLESTAKNVQQATKNELEEFHKILAKELEQYRSHVNKAVLPVAKALENKSLPAPKETPSKQAAKEPKAQQLIAASQTKLEKLLTFTLLLSLISAITSAMALLHGMH